MTEPILVDRHGRSYRKFQARTPWPGDEDRSELWLKPTANHDWRKLALAAGCFLALALLLAAIVGN